MLHERKLATAVGDEGGFAPDLPSNEAALETILEAIDRAGYKAGRQIFLGLDVASTEFFEDGIYELESEDRKFTAAQFADYLEGLVGRYPIVTIEDGMSENDWDGWALLTQRLGKRVQLVGDDLFVTNTKILKEGIEQEDRQRDPDQAEPDRHADRDAGGDRHGGATPATRRSCRIARARPRTATIADIAVATRATQIKTGSMSRSDRIAKYNQLLRIEAGAGRRGALRRRRGVPGAAARACRAELTMKFLAAGLLILLVLLQYRLWFGDGGMREVARLRAEIDAQQRARTQRCASATARSRPKCRT